jgi:hypothetical protein
VAGILVYKDQVMKLKYTLEAPDPYQRARNWAFNSTWDVFGDYLSGMPSWNIEAHEDGSIEASDGMGTRINIGTWNYDKVFDNIEIIVEHDYPTSHDRK